MVFMASFIPIPLFINQSLSVPTPATIAASNGL
jgi:hypothetical protein